MSFSKGPSGQHLLLIVANVIKGPEYRKGTSPPSGLTIIDTIKCA